MHLTIDVRMLESSGIGVFLQNTLPSIIDYFANGKITLIGKEEELRRQSWVTGYDNIHIINCAIPIYTIKEQMVLPKLIPSNTDVFWSPHYNIPLLHSGSLLVTVHDLFHLAMPEFAKGILKQGYARLMFNGINFKADNIMCISDFTKKEFIKFTRSKREDITVIPLGVDKDWFNTKKNAPFYGKPYIICVGNVKPHKNIGRLLKAYGRIMDLIPHDLVIIGERDGFLTGDPKVVDLALQFHNRVKFTGFITRSELVQYYASAEALVFPSLYEGFGLPPLEAMACGCPVVASNQASIPEVCGDAVLYFDPYQIDDIAKKILEITLDHDLRNHFILRGLERSNNYSWQKCSERIIEKINGVIK